MAVSEPVITGWRSRTTFVLALSASAVGLGNLWRFSYLSGEYGGAPFVITYIACLFFIAVPLLLAEVVLGTHGRAGPLAAIQHACDRSLLSRGWVGVGVLACFAGFLILALYFTVAGWSLAYANAMYSGLFSAAPASVVGSWFAEFLEDPVQQVYWMSLFALLTWAVVVLGVQRGIGLAVWLVVPALLAMLGFLIKFGIDNGDMPAAQAFLFNVRWVDFNATSALAALGHAFYTLGVGVATGICFGAYAPQRIPVGRSVMAVAVFDVVIALFAGLAVFPVVFANNVEPDFGPGLLFVSVPYAFGNMIHGELFGAVFFLLVVVAALGTAVALMEPIVASLMQISHVERITASLLVAWAGWLLAVGAIASVASVESPSWYGNRNLFEFLDFASAELLLPLVSLLIALFVGWRLRPEILQRELYRESRLFFLLWRFSLRYVVPLAVGLLLLAPLLSKDGL